MDGAASLTIMSFTDSIYLTGSTYINSNEPKSTCFLGHLPLSNMEHGKIVPDPVTDGDTANIEQEENMSCRSMAQDEDYLWIGGMTEKKRTVRNSPQRGFYTLYTRDHRHPDWGILRAKLVEILPHEAKVQIPDAMVIRPNNNEVYMAMVTSDDDQLTPEYYRNEGKEEFPNLTAGADYLNRGYGYYITIQVFRMENKQDGSFPQLDRNVILKTNGDLFISGMIFMEIKERILVVGHVIGKDDKYFPTDSDAVDKDGFVLQMEMDRLMFSPALRFSSLESVDDFVHNVCPSPDGESFYVVGSTRGTMPDATIYEASRSTGDLSAVVVKVSFDSTEIIWTTQLNARVGPKSTKSVAKAEAFGCHIVPHESSIMYVGGVVYDGAAMSSRLKSAGSDDL